MLDGAEHSCAIFRLKKGIPLIVPGMHYANSKALKLQRDPPSTMLNMVS
jgi:hypothetical protein